MAQNKGIGLLSEDHLPQSMTQPRDSSYAESISTGAAAAAVAQNKPVVQQSPCDHHSALRTLTLLISPHCCAHPLSLFFAFAYHLLIPHSHQVCNQPLLPFLSLASMPQSFTPAVPSLSGFFPFLTHTLYPCPATPVPHPLMLPSSPLPLPPNHFLHACLPLSPISQSPPPPPLLWLLPHPPPTILLPSPFPFNCSSPATQLNLLPFGRLQYDTVNLPFTPFHPSPPILCPAQAPSIISKLARTIQYSTVQHITFLSGPPLPLPALPTPFLHSPCFLLM